MPRQSGTPPGQVLERIPLVYLGPSARPALESNGGLLLGVQRPGWVDALAFQPLEGSTWKELVDRRLSRSDAIGIVLSRSDLARSRKALVRELVPGDVVVLSAKRGKPRCYVNRGDDLVLAPLRISRAENPPTR